MYDLHELCIHPEATCWRIFRRAEGDAEVLRKIWDKKQFVTHWRSMIVVRHGNSCKPLTNFTTNQLQVCLFTKQLECMIQIWAGVARGLPILICIRIISDEWHAQCLSWHWAGAEGNNACGISWDKFELLKLHTCRRTHCAPSMQICILSGEQIS